MLITQMSILIMKRRMEKRGRIPTYFIQRIRLIAFMKPHLSEMARVMKELS